MLKLVILTYLVKYHTWLSMFTVFTMFTVFFFLFTVWSLCLLILFTVFTVFTKNAVLFTVFWSVILKIVNKMLGSCKMHLHFILSWLSFYFNLGKPLEFHLRLSYIPFSFEILFILFVYFVYSKFCVYKNSKHNKQI